MKEEEPEVEVDPPGEEAKEQSQGWVNAAIGPTAGRTCH